METKTSSSSVDVLYANLYLDFQQKHYDQTVSYWSGHSSLSVEDLEDIISDSQLALLVQAREEEDASNILNFNYLNGIIRYKVLDRIRHQFITNKNDDSDDEESVKSNISRFVSIDDCVSSLDEERNVNSKFSKWEYDSYIDELREAGVSAWKTRIRSRLIELLLQMEDKHQKLFRYHFGIGCKKLSFEEIAPLVGLKNADSAKQVFCRKKLQIIDILKAEMDTLCAEYPSSYECLPLAS